MNVEIERPFVETMIGAFPRLSSWKEHARLGRKIEVPFHQLSTDELTLLARLYADAGPTMRAQAAHLASLQRALSVADARFGAEDDLEMLLPAIARYLAKDAIRGWLFSANAAGKALAYVVYRLDYVPASSEETGKVLVDLRADAKGSLLTLSLRFSASDIANKTVAEIFAVKGLLKETPELIAAYDDAAERYVRWRAFYGSQFSAKGVGFHAEDPASPRRDVDWSRKDILVLSTNGGSARVVNDEGILPVRSVTLDATGDILGPYLRKAAKSDRYNAEDEVEESRLAIPAGLFTQCPVHGYIRRPLYRVHSGQLGLNVAAMELALKDALTRAQRWGAVMLIDEADVYIRRRHNDMTMNAVVGVFLRVLEYFNGLLFLTTNRVEDIDEAIVSRCIALIKYYPPDAEARRKMSRTTGTPVASSGDDMTTLDETALARLEREGRLLNPVFKGESRTPGRFLFRGEVALKFAVAKENEALPPELKADQVLAAGQAGEATLPFLAAFLLSFESLHTVAEVLGDLLSPLGKYFVFCNNIDLAAKYQVPLGKGTFCVMPLDESTVYNEMLDLLHIEKNALKKLDTSGKLDAIANGAAKFRPNFEAITYEQGLGLMGPVRDPGEGRPV